MPSLAGIASVYADSQPAVGYYNLSEITTDEMVVPTRGSDWFDNGRWLEIYRQTWTANVGSALDDMNGDVERLFSGVARANLMLESSEEQRVTNAQAIAELRRSARGSTPAAGLLRRCSARDGATALEANAARSRDSVFKFLEAELNAARTVTAGARDAGQYGRLTRGAADAHSGEPLHQRGVFTKDQGINANSYNSCTGITVSGGRTPARRPIDAADESSTRGVYSLATDFKRTSP